MHKRYEHLLWRRDSGGHVVRDSHCQGLFSISKSQVLRFLPLAIVPLPFMYLLTRWRGIRGNITFVANKFKTPVAKCKPKMLCRFFSLYLLENVRLLQPFCSTFISWHIYNWLFRPLLRWLYSPLPPLRDIAQRASSIASLVSSALLPLCSGAWMSAEPWPLHGTKSKM